MKRLQIFQQFSVVPYFSFFLHANDSPKMNGLFLGTETDILNLWRQFDLAIDES
jgi:hypothetical protein